MQSSGTPNTLLINESMGLGRDPAGINPRDVHGVGELGTLRYARMPRHGQDEREKDNNSLSVDNGNELMMGDEKPDSPWIVADIVNFNGGFYIGANEEDKYRSSSTWTIEAVDSDSDCRSDKNDKSTIYTQPSESSGEEIVYPRKHSMDQSTARFPSESLKSHDESPLLSPTSDVPPVEAESSLQAGRYKPLSSRGVSVRKDTAKENKELKRKHPGLGIGVPSSVVSPQEMGKEQWSDTTGSPSGATSEVSTPRFRDRRARRKSGSSSSSSHGDALAGSRQVYIADFSHLPPSPSSSTIQQFLQRATSSNSSVARLNPPSRDTPGPSARVAHSLLRGTQEGWSSLRDEANAEALRKLDGLSRKGAHVPAHTARRASLSRPIKAGTGPQGEGIEGAKSRRRGSAPATGSIIGKKSENTNVLLVGPGVLDFSREANVPESSSSPNHADVLAGPRRGHAADLSHSPPSPSSPSIRQFLLPAPSATTPLHQSSRDTPTHSAHDGWSGMTDEATAELLNQLDEVSGKGARARASRAASLSDNRSTKTGTGPQEMTEGGRSRRRGSAPATARYSISEKKDEDIKPVPSTGLDFSNPLQTPETYASSSSSSRDVITRGRTSDFSHLPPPPPPSIRPFLQRATSPSSSATLLNPSSRDAPAYSARVAHRGVQEKRSSLDDEATAEAYRKLNGPSMKDTHAPASVGGRRRSVGLGRPTNAEAGLQWEEIPTNKLWRRGCAPTRESTNGKENEDTKEVPSITLASSDPLQIPERYASSSSSSYGDVFATPERGQATDFSHINSSAMPLHPSSRDTSLHFVHVAHSLLRETQEGWSDLDDEATAEASRVLDGLSGKATRALVSTGSPSYEEEAEWVVEERDKHKMNGLCTEAADSRKTRPGPLNLLKVSGNNSTHGSLPSALTTDRAIDDIEKVLYSDGIKTLITGKLDLDVKGGLFGYKHDFLIRFICNLTRPTAIAPDALVDGKPTDRATLHNDRLRAGFSHQTNPTEWTRLNREYVARLTRLLLGQESAMATCDVNRIYPRLTLYSLVCIMLVSYLPDGLKGATLSYTLKMLEGWNAWDNITALAHHQTVRDDLLKSISEIQGGRQDDSDENFHRTILDRILQLDASAIDALLLATLQDRAKYKQLVARHGQDAQSLLNLLQARLGFPLDPSLKRFHVRALIKLSSISGLYPECMTLKGIKLLGDSALDGGGFGDIWKGSLGGQEICIKVLKVYQRSDKVKLLKAFSAEAVIWRQLNHPNVLPFYGVFHLENDRLCLASPWMNNGNIIRFLESAPETNCVPLMLDIAQGLNYLHMLRPNIIHGDMKGANILITPSHRACLADFGLATARDSRSFAVMSSTNTRTAGTLRFQAPELLVGDADDESCCNTLASDVYAYACTCYEIFSSQAPFHEIKNDYRIISAVTKGIRPSRPSHDTSHIRGLDEEIWGIMESCWVEEPNRRPAAHQIVEHLRLSSTRNVVDERPLDEFDRSFPSRTLYAQAAHPFAALHSTTNVTG